MIGASLSGSLPSTWNSRFPRGRWTAPAIAPCSYSSGSRTSRKIALSTRRAASSGSISVMAALAAFSRSRGLGIGPPSSDGRIAIKPYQSDHDSRPERAGRAGGGPVELSQAIRSRRMVRSFAAEPLEPGLVERLIADALRAPSAGNTRGVAWLVLQGDQTTLYWEHATSPDWRRRSPRFPGLSRAPVVALALGPPDLGEGGEAAWPVPYWFGDAAFSTMLLLLGAQDAGLGAAFLGNFRQETEVLSVLGVPPGWRLFGTVLLGKPDGGDTRSRSLDRRPGPGAGRLHRGRW